MVAYITLPIQNLSKLTTELQYPARKESAFVMLYSKGDIMGLYNRITWLLNGLIQLYDRMGLSGCTTGFPGCPIGPFQLL